MTLDQSHCVRNSVSTFLKYLVKQSGIGLIFLGSALLALTQMLYILIPRFIGNYINTPRANSIILIFVLFCSVAVMSFMARIIISRVQQGLRHYSKLYIYDLVIKHGRTDHILDPGKVVNLLDTISFCVRTLFADSLTIIVTTLSLVTIVAIFLSSLSLKLASCYLLASLLFVPFSYYFAKSNSLNINGCVAISAAIAQIMTDVFSKLNVVRSFNAEKHEITFLDKELIGEEIRYKNTQLLTEKNTFIQNLVLAIINGSLIFYSIQLLKSGVLEVGDLLFVVSVVLLVGNTLSNIGEKLLAFFEYRDRLKSAWSGIITMLHENCSKITSSLNSNLNVVELRNGHFINANNLACKPLNISVKKGKITLITGINGAGKTTLLKILTGELPLISGELKWAVSRDKIIYSPQHAGLFNRTLIENLQYADEQHDLNEELKKLLPNSLVNRTNEIIGSQSMRLSGGEKQIIANIRAMHRKGDVYIFDEPTAHLDAQAQINFYERVKSFLNGKTAIIVDHNVLSRQYCDEIIEIDEFEVAENILV